MSGYSSKTLLIGIIYIIISYSFTWSILFPLSTIYNELTTIQREIWHSIGSIGPALGGIIALYLLKRKEGLILLKKRMLKSSKRQLWFFAFAPLIILFLVIMFESIIGFFNISTFLKQNKINNFLDFFIFILPSLCYGSFEEIGWRGYLLPHLQYKYNALISTLILTVIWWFWHFPTFFYRFDLVYGLIFMFPLMLSGSIIFTYLFNSSKGSLLLVIIFHISYDLVNSHQISILATVIVSSFLIFMDIRILKVYGIENFSIYEKITL